MTDDLHDDGPFEFSHVFSVPMDAELPAPRDQKGRLDLAHLQRIVAVLDGIPGGTDLPHAMLALEDAYVCCQVARMSGVSLERAREIHRETITKEETRRLLQEHGLRS